MAKVITENTTGLTKEQVATLARVAQDVFFFSTFCNVVHPVRGKVPFNLYPFQKSVLYQFVLNRFNIILKFRQAGITELISMYCLWLTMYHPNKKVNIISIKDTTAKKVLKKIKYMYKNLPWYLQVPIINGRSGEYGSASMMEFVNGSFIESIPTSSEAGRSESLSLLVIDEAAIVRWASQIWAAAFPTLSCSKGSTRLFIRKSIKGKLGEIEITPIRKLCPKHEGVLDLYNKDIYTLTHNGIWKKVLWSQNKSRLETWIVEDCRGKRDGYTPAHRLYTTQGWKTVKEIIDNNLTVIQVDTKVDELIPKVNTKPPKKEDIRQLEEFPLYYVSNFGKVYLKKNGKFVTISQRPNKDGYLRVSLKKEGVYRDSGNSINRGKHKIFQRAVHLLVAEAFIGNKPAGYQCDHIDCIRTNNYVTNLRYVSINENVKRSFDYNLNDKLSGISGKKLPDLIRRGRLLEMYNDGFTYSEIANTLYPGYKQAKKFVKRIICERGSRVYVSKLKVVKKTTMTIYDIHVEGDNSYITKNNFISHNTGGSAIVNSTPYGVGNFYHTSWVDSIAGGNAFNPIRLYWRMHPERDDAWYDQMSSALGPKRTAQEIDGDFLSSGNTVFDLVDIKAIEDCLTDWPVIKRRYNGQYMQFLEPELDSEYFIGADVATGRASDYSSFTCMDRNGEEQCIYKGRMSIDKYARLLGDTGQLYNWAVVAPESNDVGLAVTIQLQNEGYPKLYYHQKMVKKKGKSKPEMEQSPGWMTTNKNRPVIIDGLEADVRNGNVIIKDPFFVHEARTFIYDGLNRPVAMGKHQRNSDADDSLSSDVYADDDILGKAICNHIRKGKKNVIIQPR